MTPEQTAAGAKEAIHGLGGAFMRSRATRAKGAEIGLPDWLIYVAGRNGVLGDVDADVVTAAMVFFPAPWVRQQWDAARVVMAPAEALAEYAQTCHAWGRARLAEVESADRLAALLARVADAADPAGCPLFAGWRALPLPDDPPARLAQLTMVLREQRGNLHALAVLAQGLSPLEALMAGPAGQGNAAFFSWPEPYPDPEPLRARWQAAEAATERLVAPAFAALDEREREELVGLLHGAAEAARRR